ncbi:MAG: T9SS type A sorting domain-containing protein [Bacteroidia bacterium]
MHISNSHVHYLLLLLLLLYSSMVFSQTTRYVGTYGELTTAISASVANDIINITGDIVVTAEVSLNKSLIINGNDYTISVPNPGLDDMGRFNTTTSSFRVFSITTASTIVTMNDLTIKGGYVTTGGAINVSSSTTLKMNNCIVSNSRASSGGGGILNNGVVFLSNSYILRNAASYGGGFMLSGSSRMYIENSTVAENRSTSTGGGGGGAEVQNGTILYMNNSTLSNNQSTEIGGAINLYRGTVYLINSSVTGNVAYGNYGGGGVGNNNGNLYAVNTLFAHNYKRSSGSVTAPTAYILDDVVAHAGQANVRLFYCIHHASIPSGTQVLENVSYAGLQDGSDNTIFSGGGLSKITDGTGVEIGTASIYRPFLYNDGNGVAPTLKTGSFTLQSGNSGTQTRFANNDNTNPVVAYEDISGAPTWVDLQGTSSAGQLVSLDQVGASRSDPPAIGALEGVVDDLYQLKINAATDGSIDGGSIYGDVYADGTEVTLTAVPNSGYSFTRWDYVLGGTGIASTANPYTVTMDRDITLVPVYTALAGGDYTITYVGNNNTGGTAPATGTFSSSTTIASEGDLLRTGYTFSGWNTNTNGSGTDYASGATYSAGTNLILYAQWTPHATWSGVTSTDWNTTSNWIANVVPTATEPVVIPSACANYPTLVADQSVESLVLEGDITTGSNTLTIGVSAANPGTLTYISGHIIGNLTRWFATGTNSGDDSGLFPIGDGSNDRFMTVEYSSAPSAGGTLTANFQSENGGTNGLPLNGVSAVGSCAAFNVGRIFEDGFWRVTAADGLTGGTYDITLIGHNINLALLCPITAIKRTTNVDPWTQVGAHAESTGSIERAVIKRTGASGWSDWALGGKDDTFFPITLLHFTATPDFTAETIRLDWATSSEEDHSHFEIERSSDLLSWQKLQQVEGYGTTDQVQIYQYVDNQPSEINYYRLKAVSYDGTHTYSETRTVNFGENALEDRILLFPNPSEESFFIETSGEASFELYDTSGRQLARKSFYKQTEVKGLPSGIYILKINDGKSIEYRRAVVN